METELERLMVKLVGDGTSYQRMLADAEKSTAHFSSRLQMHTQQISAFGLHLRGYAGAATANVAGALGVGGIAATVGGAVSKYAQQEQTEIAFEALIGNADKAKAALTSLRKFAADTPFEQPEIMAAAKQMIAFGESAENIVPTMKSLGDVSAGLNIPLGQLVYLFGTLKSQQIAHTVDINQFAMRGIPIWQELEKITGKNNAELRLMVEHGQVGFPIIQQAFENMTKEGGKFHGQLEKQSKSLLGLFSTLKDNVGMALADLGKDISETVNLKGMIQDVGDFAQKAAELFANLSPETKRWVVYLGLGAVSLGTVLMLLPLIKGVALTAFAPFGLLLGGLFTVPGVIAAAVAALVYFGGAWGDVSKGAQNTFQYLRDRTNELGEYFRTTWTAMAAAVGAGDLELAVKIAGKRVQVEFFYMTVGMKGYWNEMIGGSNGLTDQWYNFSEQFQLEAENVKVAWELVTNAMKSHLGLEHTTKADIEAAHQAAKEAIRMKAGLEKVARDEASGKDKRAAVETADKLEGELTNLERYARVKAAFRNAFKSGIADAVGGPGAAPVLPPVNLKIVPKFDAAEWGSVEMHARVAEWREKMNVNPIGRTPGDRRPSAEALNSGSGVGGLASEFSGDPASRLLLDVMRKIEENTRGGVKVGPAALHGDDFAGGEF